MVFFFFRQFLFGLISSSPQNTSSLEGAHESLRRQSMFPRMCVRVSVDADGEEQKACSFIRTVVTVVVESSSDMSY